MDKILIKAHSGFPHSFMNIHSVVQCSGLVNTGEVDLEV